MLLRTVPLLPPSVAGRAREKDKGDAEREPRARGARRRAAAGARALCRAPARPEMTHRARVLLSRSRIQIQSVGSAGSINR